MNNFKSEIDISIEDILKSKEKELNFYKENEKKLNDKLNNFQDNIDSLKDMQNNFNAIILNNKKEKVNKDSSINIEDVMLDEKSDSDQSDKIDLPEEKKKKKIDIFKILFFITLALILIYFGIKKMSSS